MEQEQSPDTPASTAVENYPVVEEQSPDTPASTGVKTDLDQVAVAAQKDASDSVKRSASPNSDARDVSMKVDNNSHYISLYNEAIDKIFENYTTFTSVHNPKHFKSPKSSVKSDTDTCREQFLSFMSINFPKFDNMDVVQGIPFNEIEKKVKQFIKLMEVAMKDSQIVVTLHDIKKKYSSYDSDHCISEKLFMAILLAIQMLHCPTPSPGREYTLKFKFATTSFIISSLQQSSIKCAKNIVMSNLKSKDDPVAANIFNFDLRYLEPKPQSEQLKYKTWLIDTILRRLKNGGIININYQDSENEIKEKVTHLLEGIELSKETYDAVNIFLDKMETKIKNDKFVFELHDTIGYLDRDASSKRCDNIEYFLSLIKGLVDYINDPPMKESGFVYIPLFMYTAKIEAGGGFMRSNNACGKVNVNITPIKGGSKSRRRHRRHHKSKHSRKTCRRRGRKSKPNTHRRRSARHSRIRKHKKYTSRVG
jgi:hypothetical protein